LARVQITAGSAINIKIVMDTIIATQVADSIDVDRARENM
jgi:hypothetical protein